MAANELNFQQISTVLNAMYQQVTGQAAPAVTNTSEFVTVATTVLKQGYDQIMGAISQTWNRTIFSARAYNSRFVLLNRSEQEWGNAVRKLNAGDLPAVNDEQWNLTDGQSIDMYKVRLPNILQTNFYGGNAYMDYETFYREQIKQALSSPSEFAQFLSMRLTGINNRHNQWKEAFREACLANLVGGIITEAKTTRIVHLLTEYNNETGSTYTTTTIMAPDVYKGFIQWVYARINEISGLMATRNGLFSTQVTDNPIMRHTPKEMQHFYLHAKFMGQIESMTLANTFNDSWLKLGKHELVPYWQNPAATRSLKVTPSYLKADGTIGVASEAVEIDSLVGVIVDRDAMGVTDINQWSSTTPENSAGGYYNQYWHWTSRYWNDFTENAVVLLMD